MSIPAKGALDGLRVLDLTRLLPGAFCTQLLADMGAEVIKIEEPGRGDYNREFVPINVKESGSFLLLNRNKKSVTLNLKSDEGKALFLKLVAGADIVVEGFRPGVMDRLNLGYDRLAAENPGLIYCAISGFGQTGPYRLMPGHDLNYLSLAGGARLFAGRDGRPIVPGLSIADVGGGSQMAATGILAAVIARGRDGAGQFIDISMTDGAFSWLAYHGADWLFAGDNPRGGQRPFIGSAPCYNIYECADGGFVALGIIEAHFWERFCTAVGMEDLIADQWPDDDAAEVQFNRLNALFLTKPRDVWVAELEPADIPFSAVYDVGEAFDDPQLKARDMMLSVDHPVEGTIPQLGFPIKLSGTPCAITAPPPTLGQHNAELLGDLGLDDADIARLAETNVI
ncbi:acyl-CoA hydratase [Actibacterium mucosum KCTC 23349]|uniref:Acyl-CoA hydratase n=1 Tax=Actibacterium mucosum KCTC 23349 TaxID=1454373 RepID=A0A037ZE36_9RHOB|nr:CaiB/BaiF CoA-transferase family protein [Actibacterium mucosum]KAJ54377.1 acyl-CoA hydratase [Actibacterium mucosum KCTC 23349]